MIVSAFSGCGKTYTYNNRNNNLGYRLYGSYINSSFLDIDSSSYEKTDGWEKKYLDDVIEKCGTVDFIFVSCFLKVLEEIKSRGIPWVLVMPDNISKGAEDRNIIKQQWIGRLALRDNSFIRGDFVSWRKSILSEYETIINKDTIDNYKPTLVKLLNERQYLDSIIGSLYNIKLRYPEKYCVKRG